MRRAKRSSKAGSIKKAAALAVAAPQVAAIRTGRMLAAGANPSARDRTEFSRMGTEKVQAFFESMLAMGRQMMQTNEEYVRTAVLQWMRMYTTPWWLTAYGPRSTALILGPTRKQQEAAASKLVERALTPVHKRATANARRLGRIKKRS